MKLSATDAQKFREYIHNFFGHYGRHDLPWRQNYDPYRILVSEIMLQQTQVDRVIPKYLAFLERFPTAAALADAPVSAVITHWQGLGYNRRGLNLQRAAQKIVGEFSGTVPDTTEGLQSLPGIGPYTAAAIQAFAFNQPSIVIETNIRTVFIYHFFPEQYDVSDTELLPLITDTLDTEVPRLWYSALMDYGTHLKAHLPNPTRRSKTYVRQSNFATSNRRVRGLVLRAITAQTSTLSELTSALPIEPEKIERVLAELTKEGFISKHNEIYQLAE